MYLRTCGKSDNIFFVCFCFFDVQRKCQVVFKKMQICQNWKLKLIIGRNWPFISPNSLSIVTQSCVTFSPWQMQSPTMPLPLVVPKPESIKTKIHYPPASEAFRKVHWNQAQKNFTLPYTEYPWVSVLCNSVANKPPIISAACHWIGPKSVQTHTIRRGALQFATQISPLLNFKGTCQFTKT